MKKITALFLAMLLVLGSVTAISAAESGTIKLPNLIGDHMLIQQAKPIKLWGTAGSGETVTITLGTNSNIVSQGTATADENGDFRTELPAVMAGGPYTLTFSTPSATKTVEDVLVGELWVQSGQSNMARLTSQIGTYGTEILPSATNNQIRLFIDTGSTTASEPSDDLQGTWRIATRTAANTYSAVGFAALETLQNKLGIPVGGICNAVSGASMSQFMGPNDASSAGGYYYAKTSPLTQMNIRGVMWYQGEGDRNSTSEAFTSTFNKLIKTWRTDWENNDMPFVYVMLPPSPMKYWANWTNSYIMEDFSSARLGQLESFYTNENVAFAVSMDCPPNQGEDSLHPNNKKPIGQRLALAALDLIYNIIDNGMSPVYRNAVVEGNTAIISFSYIDDGLKTTDDEAPRCFMAAGKDKQFYEATAEIVENRDAVKITCPQVSEIKYISYAVEKQMYPYTSPDNAVIDTYADVNLVDSTGLPLCPFSYAVDVNRSDKQAQLIVPNLSRTVALNDSYLLPSQIKLSDYDGSQDLYSVMWSEKSINTKKPGTTNLFGCVHQCDILIPCSITVKEIEEENLFSDVNVSVENNKATVTLVPDELPRADRSLYLTTAFYKADGTFLGAKLLPYTVMKDELPNISCEADIPEGAAKMKIMILNHALRPWLPVTEQDLTE